MVALTYLIFKLFMHYLSFSHTVSVVFLAINLFVFVMGTLNDHCEVRSEFLKHLLREIRF